MLFKTESIENLGRIVFIQALIFFFHHEYVFVWIGAYL